MKKWAADRLQEWRDQSYELGEALLEARGLLTFIRFEWKKYLFAKGINAIVRQQKLTNTPERNQELVDQMVTLEDTFEQDIQALIIPKDRPWVE